MFARLFRYTSAMVLALPATCLAIFDIHLLAGGQLSGELAFWLWLILWGLVSVALSTASTIRMVWGKACLAYAVSAFLLPIAGIIFPVVFASLELGPTTSFVDAAGLAAASVILLVLTFVVGLFSGFLSLALGYFALRPARP